MGKQLYFAHMEADLPEFLETLSEMRCKILVNGILYEPQTALPKIVSDMTTFMPTYSVVQSSENIPERQYRCACVEDGTALEFLNSWRWDLQSQTYYDKGRIYLRPMRDGTYDPNLLSVYNNLRRFFRKKYFLNKSPSIYLSFRFKGEYDFHNVFFSQLGHPFTL